ncbi:hypothetical protein B4144_3960 [Bacillus atrophaeus]|nr:hypothetical protein B4144_3960 [Bacillus atrophaeus]
MGSNHIPHLLFAIRLYRQRMDVRAWTPGAWINHCAPLAKTKSSIR